jgi:nucleoside-diphosphate-sugar epimerase
MRHPIVEEDLRRIVQTPLPWDALRGSKVLVSGANGFLPAYMVETLMYLNEVRSGQNTSVIALVRDAERARDRFAHYLGRPDLQFLVQDVSVPVPTGVRADIVIHAASQASPRFYGADPVGTLTANVLGTHNLLELASRSDAKAFLFFSSSEVYGRAASPDAFLREDDYGALDPTEVRSCYAEGKRCGETLCVSWQHQYRLPVKIVRPFHTYGPGMRLDDGRVFADFVADIVNHRPIVLRSAGTAVRAFCYLADAVAGFFTVLFEGQEGAAYNVANDQCRCSIRALAELLVDLFPERRLDVVHEEGAYVKGYIPSKVMSNCPDVSKIRRLGWAPTTGLREGFRRTVQSLEWSSATSNKRAGTEPVARG